MPKTIAGIDFSMSCPGICVHDTDPPFSFENNKYYFLTDKKYLDGKLMDNVYGTFFTKKDYSDNIKRFNAITEWTMDKIGNSFHVAIEGYSFGSKGKHFQIGENTGILKSSIISKDIKMTIYSPKEIKMFAVNNSPVDFSKFNKNKILKPEMFKIFLEETGTNLQKILTPKKTKIDSPVGDIIDSHYICKLLHKDIYH